jgi:CRP-like cAMP-binding protein
MTREEIYISIQHMTGVSENELSFILGHFEEQKLKKKTTILKAGKIAKDVYLVIEGCLRLYYEKDGQDLSAYFFTEGMFAGAYDSFTTRRPSRHSIETIEDSTILTVSYTNWLELFREFPRMNLFVRKIIEERFISLHQLFTSHILDSPEERYMQLLKNYPELINRVPQHQLATFLGVTPVSLSRIRNRVSKK